MLYAIIAAIILIADQWVKYWTTINIVLDTESMPFIPGVLKLVNIHNSGAAFGFMSSNENMRWIFVGIAVVFTIALIIIIARKVFPSWFANLCCTFAIAGAIGNCIDRFLFGYVVDMFKVEFINFAVFNVADVFLVIACVLFIFYLIFGYNGKEEIEAVEETPEKAEKADKAEKKAEKKAQKEQKKAEKKEKKAKKEKKNKAEAEKKAESEKAVEEKPAEKAASEEAVGVSEIKSADISEDEINDLKLSLEDSTPEPDIVIEEPSEPVSEAKPEAAEAETDAFSLDGIFDKKPAEPEKVPEKVPVAEPATPAAAPETSVDGIEYSLDAILDEFK